MEALLPLHFLMLPFPSQGHITPMRHLASLLTRHRNTIVTFVSTYRSHHETIVNLKEQDDNGSSPSAPLSDMAGIRFVSVPDGLPHDFSVESVATSPDRIFFMLDAFERQRPLIEALIAGSTPPITCVIADSFLLWTQDMANKLGISRVALWTSSAPALCYFTILARGRIPPDLGFLDKEMRAMLDASPEGLRAFTVKKFEGLDETACILVYSIQELAAGFVEAIQGEVKPPVRCIGPVLMPDGQNGAVTTTTYAEAMAEDMECLAWLDQQAPSSVLYMAFGSLAVPTPSQIKQLALGIEASKQPFIWATRNRTAGIPEGFMERIQGQGLMVSWAPQLQILGHPSISCFLTHCGWNSTIESLFMGVPMLCLPFFHDQGMNELLIEKVWQVGLGLSQKKGTDGVVSKEEVERAIGCIMARDSEEGRRIREQALRWKSMARSAVQPGGSSYAQLEQFVDSMVDARNRHIPK